MKTLKKITYVMWIIGIIMIVFGGLLAHAGAGYVEGMIALTGFGITIFGAVLNAYCIECMKFKKSRAKK